jgi:threonine synthase
MTHGESDTGSLYAQLVSSKDGSAYDITTLQTFCTTHTKPLLVEYDLTHAPDKTALANRKTSMWRYLELLPVWQHKNIISLGEGFTPLNKISKLAEKYQTPNLWVKDEAYNPTGSFKARGLSMAISKAKELGVKTCIIPTAGNAGGAMSAYCALAGIEAHVFMPEATPEVFKKECALHGAKVTTINGTIRDCGKAVAEARKPDWFDVSTLKEPFRIEGKKTMGYEIAEQMNWSVPDVIVYPTGGGTGLIGIWKALQEMQKMGWIGANVKLPRMVAVQVKGCSPIVQAFSQNLSEATPFENPSSTIANGLRVPAAFGDALILKALYESGGTAISVTENEMLAGITELASAEGLMVAPEGAAVWEAFKKLRAQNWIKGEEKIVLLNTGSIYKYMENIAGI